MRYPGLLFTSEESAGTVSPQVFEDLKLNTLLDGRALSRMERVCTAADQARRAELFDALEDRDVLAAVSRLAESAQAMRLSFEAAQKCDSRIARAVLFVRRTDRLDAFCREAQALAGKGFLLDRFAGFFAGLARDPDFSEAVAAASDAAEKARVFNRLSLKAGAPGGDEPYAGPASEPNEPFGAQLRRIAGEIGVPVKAAKDIGCAVAGETFDLAASSHPDEAALAVGVYEKYAADEDPSIYRCADELHFAKAVCRLLARAREAGLPVCRVTKTAKKIFSASGLYDLTLLAKDERNIVPNDVSLTGDEPFFFLSGANGGGKTTYLRALGVNVLLAVNCGRAIADSAEIGPVDGVFTHFPGDEDFVGEGRFANEVARADSILAALGSFPVVLLNETYSTTSNDKSVEYTCDLAHELIARGALGVYVTHAKGVRAAGAGSLICQVDPDDANRRTYKIVRANGGTRSYAADVLGKYGLTEEALRERFPERGGGETV